MNKIIILLACLVFAGCGRDVNTSVSTINKIRDNCRGTLTMTVTISSWNDQLDVSCTENVDDEARAKRKDNQ